MVLEVQIGEGNPFTVETVFVEGEDDVVTRLFIDDEELVPEFPVRVHVRAFGGIQTSNAGNHDEMTVYLGIHQMPDAAYFKDGIASQKVRNFPVEITAL
ncbi:MAG: hypothetical protein QY314_03070 [Candidatus Dojkabacteria bacterium]|nr:MAG: hypothetical protein QY314_03070 [Candidatus Dojkabacteria bacterium]